MGKPNSGSCLEGCGSWAAPALLHFTHSLLYSVGRMECERISIVCNIGLPQCSFLAPAASLVRSPSHVGHNWAALKEDDLPF